MRTIGKMDFRNLKSGELRDGTEILEVFSGKLIGVFIPAPVWAELETERRAWILDAETRANIYAP